MARPADQLDWDHEDWMDYTLDTLESNVGAMMTTVYAERDDESTPQAPKTYKLGDVIRGQGWPAITVNAGTEDSVRLDETGELVDYAIVVGGVFVGGMTEEYARKEAMRLGESCQRVLETASTNPYYFLFDVGEIDLGSATSHAGRLQQEFAIDVLVANRPRALG